MHPKAQAIPTMYGIAIGIVTQTRSFESMRVNVQATPTMYGFTISIVT